MKYLWIRTIVLLSCPLVTLMRAHEQKILDAQNKVRHYYVGIYDFFNRVAVAYAESVSSGHIRQIQKKEESIKNSSPSCGSDYANIFRAQSLQQHAAHRATVVHSKNIQYCLGSIINFDTVLDDPHENILFGPTRYVVPISGYYVVTVHIDQCQLTGNVPLKGMAVSTLSITVNGAIFREISVPYDARENQHTIAITSLLGLKKADEVSAVYNVYVMCDEEDVRPYKGTVVMSGNGLESNRSLLKVHLLTPDNNEKNNSKELSSDELVMNVFPKISQ